MTSVAGVDEWMDAAREAFADAVAEFARYGVSPHPDLRLVHEDCPTPYYEAATLTIGVGMPDTTTIRGRLWWLATARVLGVEGVDAAIEALGKQLPLLMAHELTHHLRHHYGAPIDNDFIEEQVANTVAIAFVNEHPRYRPGVPDLLNSMQHSRDALAQAAPESVGYLAGFNVELADVLIAEELLDREEVASLQRVAAAAGESLDRAADRLLTGTLLGRAREAQRQAEGYFNRRYTTSLFEYALFATDWLSVHLARTDMPTLGRALQSHILTADWEQERLEETALLLETTAQGQSDALAVAAAAGLLELRGRGAINDLLRLLHHPSPSRRAGILATLAPYAEEEVVAAAACAHAERTPVERAAAASVLAAKGDPQGALILVELIAGPIDDQAAALRTLAEYHLRELEQPILAAASSDAWNVRALAAGALVHQGESGQVDEAVRSLLADADDRVRRATAAALATHPRPGLATFLAAALDDADRAVRQYAAEALKAVPADAGNALRTFDGPLSARAEAAAILMHLTDEEAPARCRLLVEEAVAQARGLPVERVDTPLARLLEDAVTEQRRSLLALALRLIALTEDDRLGLASEALGSRNPAERDAGIEVARSALANKASTSLAPLFHADADSPRAIDAIDNQDPLVAELAKSVAGVDALGERALLTTIERLVFLRSIPVFGGVPLSMLRSLAEQTVLSRYAAGEEIFATGDDADRLYVITVGRIAIEHVDDARRQLLAELGPGQSFGEAALIPDGRRNAAARALEDTTLLGIDRDEFQRAGMREPEILLEILRVLHARLERANALLGQRGS